ncbi:MAG: anti-sigma factor [Gemmatimonadaceae bacterium]
MSNISHEEAFSELAAVALDAVSPEVAREVRAHASVCPECGPELAAMDATAAELGVMVPDAQMSGGRGAGIRSRLVMRARAERELRTASGAGAPDLTRGVASLPGQGHRYSPGGQQPPVSADVPHLAPSPEIRSTPVTPLRRSTNWFAIAATLALVATGAQLMRVTTDREQVRSQLATAETKIPVGDSLVGALSERDSMIAAMTGPDVKVVALANEATKETLGKMMWNRASDDWIMVAYRLKQPVAGKTYQVWLVTDSAKISAGTFRPDNEGHFVMHARYAMAPDALRAVAITEEPEGGVPAPTGPMVVVGSA